MKKKTTEKRDHQLDQELSAIYRDAEGRMPDLTKLEPQRSRWGAAVIAAIAGAAAILIGAAWVGFSVFHPLGKSSSQGLLLSIEGPERVSLGEEITYFINYQNVAPAPLTDAQVRITFPSDFTMTGSEPGMDPTARRWQIGSIPVDGHGTVKVRGIYMGALGTVTAIQVVGTYHRATDAGVLDALATKSLRYEKSVLDGSLDLPSSVLPGDRVAFTYRVTNTGQHDIPNLVARFTLPAGFQMDVATSTMLEKGIAQQSIGTLAEGASSTVVVYGTFASGASGKLAVTAEAGSIGQDGSFFANQRTTESFTVFAGDLSLKMVVNGSDTDSVISYGDRLRFSLQYENTAGEDLHDVSLRFRIESPSGTGATMTDLVDWTSSSDSASGTRRGNVVTWTEKQIPLLAKLPAHELGTIDLDLRALPEEAATGTQAARVVVEATVGSVGAVKMTQVNRVIQSTPIVLSYLSDASFTTDARYFTEEGAPIGKGPLPPVVKETTTYRVHWEISKRVHSLTNVKVTALLSPIASWTGNTSAGTGGVTYDGTTGVVTWTIPYLAASEDGASADFDLAITPTEADADRFARILGESRFEATDMEVSKVISQTQSAITTDLQNDETAHGKGVVRKP